MNGTIISGYVVDQRPCFLDVKSMEAARNEVSRMTATNSAACRSIHPDTGLNNTLRYDVF